MKELNEHLMSKNIIIIIIIIIGKIENEFFSLKIIDIENEAKRKN